MFALCYVQTLFAWGKEGHAAVAYIAERNLTPQAKANLEKALDNHSIVFYASWLDYYRKCHKRWDKRAHVATYDVQTGKPVGKGISNMKETISLLKNYKTLPDSVFKFNIYALIHQMGDFHCPGHVCFVDDKGNKVQYSNYSIKFLTPDRIEGYHHFWDGVLLADIHGDWSYMDYEAALNHVPAEKKAKMLEGTLEDWLQENALGCRFVYEVVPGRPKAPKNELFLLERPLENELGEFALRQILKGGVRLAAVLNEIFGE